MVELKVPGGHASAEVAPFLQWNPLEEVGNKTLSLKKIKINISQLTFYIN